MKTKVMKKIITLCIALTTLSAQAQNFSPTLNRNFELIFVDYLMPYNTLINIDPSTNPVDTFGFVEVLKNANGAYLQGREFESGNLVSSWLCSNNGNINTVYMTNPLNGDTVQMDKIHRDAQGRDTLYQTYYDTTFPATGSLILSEELRLFYGPHGVESAAISEVNGGLGFGNNINYTVYRNAQNKVDSLVADIEFMGSKFPIQTLIYFASNNQLDSINLKNTLSGEVEEQVRVINNSNGLVEKFFIYERGNNNAWTLYDEYHLSANTFFGLSQKSALSLNLYPNPSQGLLNLNNPLSADLKIFNLNGELVCEQSGLSPQSQVNLKSVAKGFYFAQIRLSDGSFYSEKILLN